MSSTQIAIRLDDEELAALDVEVESGRSANRSDAVRRGIKRLQREHRSRRDEQLIIEIMRRGEALYPDLDGWHTSAHHGLD